MTGLDVDEEWMAMGHPESFPFSPEFHVRPVDHELNDKLRRESLA
jgi:hypothetical protein